MMKACMDHAVKMSKEIPETMGMQMFWRPDSGIPEAAKVFDNWKPPKEPGPRKPAQIIKFEKPEDK
jgi:hypothetical protein